MIGTASLTSISTRVLKYVSNRSAMCEAGIDPSRKTRVSEIRPDIHKMDVQFHTHKYESIGFQNSDNRYGLKRIRFETDAFWNECQRRS